MALDKVVGCSVPSLRKVGETIARVFHSIVDPRCRPILPREIQRSLVAPCNTQAPAPDPTSPPVTIITSALLLGDRAPSCFLRSRRGANATVTQAARAIRVRCGRQTSAARPAFSTSDLASSNSKSSSRRLTRYESPRCTCLTSVWRTASSSTRSPSTMSRVTRRL